MVPPERFKSNATHMVPLSDQAMAVLLSVPHFTKGDYLFSTTLGERPVGGFQQGEGTPRQADERPSVGYPRYPQDSANQAGFIAHS